MYNRTIKLFTINEDDRYIDIYRRRLAKIRYGVRINSESRLCNFRCFSSARTKESTTNFEYKKKACLSHIFYLDDSFLFFLSSSSGTST